MRTDLFVILGVEPLNNTLAKSEGGVLKKTCHRPEVTKTKNLASVEEDAVFLFLLRLPQLVVENWQPNTCSKARAMPRNAGQLFQIC